MAVLAFAGCNTEDSVDTEKSPTFVRYINGGNSDEAVQVAQTTDGGFVILANTTINSSSTFSKIKLVKVDEFGNLLWTRLFPEFGEDTDAENIRINRRGASFIITESGGYAIAGQDIQASGKSNLFVMVTNSEGIIQQQKSFNTANSTSGRAITTTATGNFLVLADVPGMAENIALFELSQSDLNQVWTRSYGDGESTLANKLFFDQGSRITWAGSVTLNSTTKIRMVQVPVNSSLTLTAAPIGLPGVEEQGRDICRFGFGYAVVGSTTLKSDNSIGDRDVYYQLFTANGLPIANAARSFPDENNVGVNEVGNAICSTFDGGLFLLGTSSPEGDQGSEFYMVKIDAFGNIQPGWPKTYGSRFDDRGVSAIQAADRSLIVLGTTNLGGRGTIMLMKMDRNGNIQ